MSQPDLAVPTRTEIDTTMTSADQVEWQRAWLGTLKTRWKSLVIIPVDSSVDPLRVGDALVAVGSQHDGKAVQCVDARGTTLGHVQLVTSQIRALVDAGHRVMVIIDPCQDNPAAIPIARAASAAVLIVRARATTLESARSVLEAVGHDRVIGGILVG